MARLAVICGIDEVGRGPWAGPVCAGAVILDPDRKIEGLADSKALTPARRDSLAEEIREKAVEHALGWASPQEVDRVNVREATFLAMRRAVSRLQTQVSLALIDGRDVPDGLPCKGRAVIGGDGSEPVISAASILAKVARDALMVEEDERYPGYGFAAHKGYGTRVHIEALARLGPCPIHRMSFAPVAAALRKSA